MRRKRSRQGQCRRKRHSMHQICAGSPWRIAQTRTARFFLQSATVPFDAGPPRAPLPPRRLSFCVRIRT